MSKPDREHSGASLFHAGGKHNVSPWPYLLGIGGAVIAVLFAWQASLRAQRKAAPANDAVPQVSPQDSGTEEERLIWLE